MRLSGFDNVQHYYRYTPPSLPAGCVITGGTMHEQAQSAQGIGYFYDITGSWNSSVTWNTAPSVSGTLVGAMSIPASMAWDSADISAGVRYWNSSSNYGLEETGQYGNYNTYGGIYSAGSAPYTPYIALSYYNEPGAISLSSVTPVSVTATWSANGNDSTPTYNLYRNGTLIYSGTGLSYTDTGVSPGTGYTYTVKVAYTAPSGYTDTGTTYYSATQTASTTTPIVAAPGAFTTPTYGQTSIALNWGTNGQGGTFYVLTRNGSQIYSGANTTYTDSGLATGTTYSYIVKTGITGGAGTFYSTTQTASYATLPGNPTVTGACGLQAWSGTGGTGYVTLS